MSAEVENRRFRTWEEGAHANVVKSWSLLVRYQINRYARTWYVYMVIILGIFGAMLGLFLMSLVAGETGGMPLGARPNIISEAPMAFIGIGMILFAMFVTAPSIAEDLRFNAQLFYFSKPLRVRDYMLGKNIFNFLGMAVVGLIPVLILSASVLATGPGDETALRQWYAEDGYDSQEINRLIADWKYTGVDTWSDALYLAFMPVAAVASLSVGLVGLTMAVSSFTRRAWHAAVGTVVLVMGWSVLGAIVGDGIRSTRGLLYYPMGWVDAIVFLPFRHRFPWDADCRDYTPGEGGYGSYCEYLAEEVKYADSTIPLAHLFLILTGVIGIAVTWLRVKSTEGAA